MEERNCLACNEPFTGRIDKKFCSDYCRNSFNNSQNKDANNFIRNVNYILRKNRRILKSLNPEGKAKISKSKLDLKGFNYDYFTSIYTTKAGSTYYYCYDQGYLFLEDGFVAIVDKYETPGKI